MSEKKLHFKRRRYGYGWTPVTPLAWSVILGYLFAVIIGALWFLRDEPDNTLTTKVILYIVFVILGGIGLVLFSAKKGPNPKWRWGRSESDNPEEDI